MCCRIQCRVVGIEADLQLAVGSFHHSSSARRCSLPTNKLQVSRSATTLAGDCTPPFDITIKARCSSGSCSPGAISGFAAVIQSCTQVRDVVVTVQDPCLQLSNSIQVHHLPRP